MKRSFHVGRVAFHPASLAIFSGVLAAVGGFLINIAAGGKAAQSIWIALVFAMLLSLALTAWQASAQEKSGQHMMTMLQEMVFQTYFLTVLADKPEISQMAQQRLGQMLTTLTAEQQVSMLKFLSNNGLPATFVGDALQKSTALTGADLHQIALPQLHLEQAHLERTNLSGANLREAHLQGASLHRANLAGANLSQANLRRADLRSADLRGTNFTGADLTEANLGSEKAERASEKPGAGRRLQRHLGANLTNALLSHAHLRGANLMQADLTGANLQGADLTQAALYEAILGGADLQGADLTQAVLYESSFDGANLQGANLTEANLYNAILRGANLQGADLTQALLYGAILDGADIRTAKVTDEQLQTVRTSLNMKRESKS